MRNLNDLKIIEVMISMNCFSPRNGATISSIHEYCADISVQGIRKRIGELTKNGLLAFGLKDAKSNMYYVTEKGLDAFRELMEVK